MDANTIYAILANPARVQEIFVAVFGSPTGPYPAYDQMNATQRVNLDRIYDQMTAGLNHEEKRELNASFARVIAQGGVVLGSSGQQCEVCAPLRRMGLPTACSRCG